jgi:hypothetical protein
VSQSLPSSTLSTDTRNSKIFLLWRNTGRTPLLTLLLRDGLVFLAAVLIVNLLNTVAFIRNSPANNPALHSPFSEWCARAPARLWLPHGGVDPDAAAHSWTSMMCSRIVLSLRKNAYKSGPISAGKPFSGGSGGGGGGVKFSHGQQTTILPDDDGAPRFALRDLRANGTIDLEKQAHAHDLDAASVERGHPFAYAPSDQDKPYVSGVHVNIEKRVVHEA